MMLIGMINPAELFSTASFSQVVILTLWVLAFAIADGSHGCCDREDRGDDFEEAGELHVDYF